NFGYSPKYAFQNKMEIDGRGVEVNLKTVKGIIIEIQIGGDYFSKEINRQLSENLQDKRHFFENVRRELKSVSEDISDDLVYAFF
ncbi:MAG TPA: lipoate protein ligase C-terminal domain-containing protein, partial [Draconibacterium sp.]|nr:lipoate protein ligase C-terminal domain-containing protein [Draconibacterium sp.]